MVTIRLKRTLIFTIVLPVLVGIVLLGIQKLLFSLATSVKASPTSENIIYVDASSCPTGWTEFTQARGRYIVGLNAGGTLDGTDGTALSNLEDRPTGQHAHSITDVSHTHTFFGWNQGSGSDSSYPSGAVSGTAYGMTTSSAVTSITLNATGTVAGTNAPYIQLLVCGISSSDPTANQMPPNAVIFYNGASAPTGWTEFTQARGRYIVGLNAGGTLDGTDGTALSNLEDRPTGQHTHTVNDPGHTHTYYGFNQGSGSDSSYPSGASSGNNTYTLNVSVSLSGVSINAAGSVAGTNAPYMQLLAIKNTSGINQSVPLNAVMFYDGTTAPGGYVELTAARGRYIVGLNAGGSLDGTDGTALSNLEDRPTGQHTHSINDAGHSHLVYGWNQGRGSGTSYPSGAVSGQNTYGLATSYSLTGITINAFGAVAGTNAPYMQLLAIQVSDATPPNNVAITNFGPQCYQPTGGNVVPNKVTGVASDNIAVTKAWYQIQQNPAGNGLCLDSTNNTFDTSCGSITGRTIAKYDMTPDRVNSIPTSWTFQASNDNSTWTTLDTQSGVTTGWAVNVAREFSVPANKQSLYRYYRLNATANNGHLQGDIDMAEFGMKDTTGAFVTSGGTSFGSGSNTSYAFDNNLTTAWSAGATLANETGQIGYDFAGNGTNQKNQILTFNGSPINYGASPTAPINSAVFASPAPSPNDKYAIQLFAQDAAGNTGSSTPINFQVDAACLAPFLQTTQGDVHSNTQINTPGGP